MQINDYWDKHSAVETHGNAEPGVSQQEPLGGGLEFTDSRGTSAKAEGLELESRAAQTVPWSPSLLPLSFSHRTTDLLMSHTGTPLSSDGLQTSKHPSFLFTSSWDWRLIMSVCPHLLPSDKALVLRVLWPAACFESLLSIPMAPHTCPVKPLVSCIGTASCQGH